MKNSINHMYSIPRNRVGEYLTDFEKQHILSFDPKVDLTKTPMPSRFHHFSCIEMNSTYIELTDYYFSRIGRALGVGVFGFAILLILPIFSSLFFILFLDPPFYSSLYVMIPIEVYMMYLALKNFQALKYYELQGYYYLPTRFNRTNKKIYLYLKDGTQVERKPSQVIMTISQIRAFMDAKEYIISVFELDDEGKISSHSTLGQASVNKNYLIQFWKFINVYWVHGPEPLMPTYVENDKKVYAQEYEYLTYCNDVKKKEPQVIDSWKRIRLTHHDFLLFTLFCLPYDVLNLIARRICLKRRIMPKWNTEIEQKNQVDPNDPYIVTAKDNYEYTSFGMKRKHE